MYKHVLKMKEPPNEAMARGAQIHNLAEDFIKSKITKLPVELTKFKELFQMLRKHIAQRLDDIDIVIVDSLTTFVSHVPEQETLTFFTLCKEFCDLGKSLLFTIHSHSFSEEIFIRLRSICDAHMRLRVEEVGGERHGW